MKYLVKKSESSCSTPGKKIRSQGQGRGLGIGKGKGPIGGAFGRAVAETEKTKKAVMNKESSFGPAGYFDALEVLGIKLAGFQRRKDRENYHILEHPLSSALVGGGAGLMLGEAKGQADRVFSELKRQALGRPQGYVDKALQKQLWGKRLLGLGGGAAVGLAMNHLIHKTMQALEEQNAQRAQEE